MDWKLELVAIPVSDVDRAKAFYTDKAGFNADHDYRVSDEIRFVQLTPPGSACSIALGTGIVDAPPGSVQGVQLVVSQVEGVLKQHGCQPIETVGKPFDPHEHQALAQEPSNEHPAGTVSRETQVGYKLQDRVIRPAQVFVSTGPTKT